MKRLLYTLLFLLVSNFIIGQVTPYTGLRGYPIIQNIGSDSAMVTNKSAIGTKFVVYRFTDTTAANLTPIKNYPFAIIADNTNNMLWTRNKFATQWMAGSGSIDISSFTFLTDSSIVICYSNGVCDTIAMYNFTEVVTNIIQNFNDSSIYNYNDSTLIICHGVGDARVCDTISLGNSNTYYFTVTGDTVITCDTLQIVCQGDSCYQFQQCDTIPLTNQLSALHIQNGLRFLPGTHIGEWGGADDGNTPANLIHDTWINGGTNQLTFEAATNGRPIAVFHNYQFGQLSASISSWRHSGAYQPTYNLLDENNAVSLYLSYTDPFAIPTQGTLSGDTVGFMGNRYGYFIMTNGKGSNNQLAIDDVTAKQVGIFFPTYGDDEDGVTIFGQQTPASYAFFNNPPTDSTLYDRRIAVFKTNKQQQNPAYGDGTFTGTMTYALAVDADGNFIEFPPGGASGILVDANNGLSVVSSTTVQLFGTLATPATLLNDRYLDQGEYELNQTGSTAGYLVNYTNSSGGLNVTTDGIGVNVVSGSTGVKTDGTSFGIQTTSSTLPVYSTLSNSSTNVIEDNMLLYHLTSGTAAAGFGTRISFGLENSGGNTVVSNTISSKWTTATIGAEVSQFIIAGMDNSTIADLFTLSGSGETRLNKYGVGTFTSGTGAYLIATKADGSLMEYPVGGLPGGGALITADNGITANTATNVQLGGTGIQYTNIDWGQFSFTNTFNSIDSSGFVISSNSTAAADNQQMLLKVLLSGVNSNSNQRTYGIYSENTHTGGGTTFNYGVYGGASGATLNYGVYGTATTAGVYGNGGSIGVYGQTSDGSGFGVQGLNSGGGVGVYGYAPDGLPGQFTQVNSTLANSVDAVVKITKSSTAGVGANGIGGSIEFYVQDDVGVGNIDLTNQIISKWTTAASATRVSQLLFTGVGTAVTNNIMAVDGTGVVGIGKFSSFGATRLDVVDNSVGANSIVNISSTSTAAASNLQKGLNISLTGANATASQNTYGLYVNNAHSGSSNANYGIWVTTSNSSSGAGIVSQSVSSVALNIQSESNAAFLSSVYPSSTNTVIPNTQLRRFTTGTAADGIGESLDFIIQTSTGNQTAVVNQITSKLTTANNATRTSQLSFTGVTGAATETWLTLGQSGYVQFRPMTVTEAGAITPAEGLMLFVSNTDATWTSVGLWIYQNGAWKAL